MSMGLGGTREGAHEHASPRWRLGIRLPQGAVGRPHPEAAQMPTSIFARFSNGSEESRSGQFVQTSVPRAAWHGHTFPSKNGGQNIDANLQVQSVFPRKGEADDKLLGDATSINEPHDIS